MILEPEAENPEVCRSAAGGRATGRGCPARDHRRLISRAKAGDLKAAVYLCDRIMGRTAGAKVAPADDREAPYTEAAFELDKKSEEEDNDIRTDDVA